MIRKLYVDMEMATIDPNVAKVFADPKIASHNIVSIVAYDNYTTNYYAFVYREDFEERQWTEIRVMKNNKEHKIILYTTGYERKLCLAFAKLWQKLGPDVRFTWNGDNFDWPYYFRRCERLDIDKQVARRVSANQRVDIDYRYMDIPGSKSFDLMKGAKKILGKYVDGSLESVSQLILGYGKLGDTVSAVAAWRYDVERLIDYNIRDTELMVYLDEKMPIFDFFMEQIKITGSGYHDTLTANYRVCQDFIKYNKAEHPYLDDFLIPVKDTEDAKDFKGAITLEPTIGIHPYVAVDDLKMMYPNIMLSCNMSPETVVPKHKIKPEMNCVKVGNVHFRTDFEGFIPRLIRMQIEIRKSVERDIDEFAKNYGKGFDDTEEFKTFMKKRMSIKNLVNSWYGIFGYKKFMMYTLDIAKSVTKVGREQLIWSKDYVYDKYKIDTNYGDTDSCFIDTPRTTANFELLDELGNEYYELTEQLRAMEKKQDLSKATEIVKRIEEIWPHLEHEYNLIIMLHTKVAKEITDSYDDFAAQYNIKNHTFEMTFEKLYRRIFFAKRKADDDAARKRYCGHLVYKDGKFVDSLDIVGFQAKRSDTAEVTIKCQKAVLNRIVFSPEPKKEVFKLIRKFHSYVLSGHTTSEFVGIPRGFGKSLKSYEKKNRTYRWYAAEWANRYMATNYGKGSKPKGVSLKYIPPPYNQFPKHPKHKHNWILFDSENKLRPEFEEVINWKFMAFKTIEEPMSTIIESIGMKMKDIIVGVVRQSVRSGF